MPTRTKPAPKPKRHPAKPPKAEGSGKRTRLTRPRETDLGSVAPHVEAGEPAAPRLRDRVREFRRVPASDLRPNPENWRLHPQGQVDALREIIADVGFAGAELAFPADGKGPDGDFSDLMLVDGHLRREIVGDELIPVLVTDLTLAEARKLMVVFDPIGAMAEADAAKLDALLREIDVDTPALMELCREVARDAECEWAKETATKEVVEDEVPEPPADPVTKPGDLWILGRHRLLCGDSTKREDVERLMDGKRAQCVVTDPPYGVSQAAKNRLLNEHGGKGGNVERNVPDIVDDDLSPAELEKRLLPAFVNLQQCVMGEDCTLFVTAPQLAELYLMMMQMMQAAGVKVRHVLIWKKNSPTFSMGRLDYDYQHEPILLTWGKRHKRPMAGKHRTSVWEIDRPRKSEEHPTMKPVELYANAYQNNSEDGDAVADLYAGSGTAFAAAEQLDRTCYGMEISPAYCDVICKRWSNLTGGTPKRS